MFPAPAGMSPKFGIHHLGRTNVPRTRGDEPSLRSEQFSVDTCSPHPRG